MRSLHSQNPKNSQLSSLRSSLLRSLFTVGLICTHFDMDSFSSQQTQVNVFQPSQLTCVHVHVCMYSQHSFLILPVSIPRLHSPVVVFLYFAIKAGEQGYILATYSHTCSSLHCWSNDLHVHVYQYIHVRSPPPPGKPNQQSSILTSSILLQTP